MNARRFDIHRFIGDGLFYKTGALLSLLVVLASLPSAVSVLLPDQWEKLAATLFPLRWASASVLLVGALVNISYIYRSRIGNDRGHFALRMVSTLPLILSFTYTPLTLSEFSQILSLSPGSQEKELLYGVYPGSLLSGPSPFFLLESFILSLFLFFRGWFPARFTPLRDALNLAGVVIAFQLIFLLTINPITVRSEVYLSPLHLPGLILYLMLLTSFLLADPDRGILLMVRKNHSTSQVMRRLLPVIIFVPPMLDFLGYVGTDHTTFSMEIRYHILFIYLSAILAGVTVYIAYNLEKLELLRESQDKKIQYQKNLFTGLFEHVPIGLLLCNENGEIEYVNQAAGEIWEGAMYVGPDRYSSYEAIRLSDGKQLEAEDWAIHRVMKEGRAELNEELLITDFSGNQKYIINSVFPLFDAEGKAEAYAVLNEDITEKMIKQNETMELNRELEQKVLDRTAELNTKVERLEQEISFRREAEQTNRELTAIYQALIDHYPQGAIFLFDHDIRYTIVGGDELNRLGYNPEKDIIGKKPHEVLGVQSGPMIEDMVSRCFHGETHSFELERRDSSYTITMAPVRNDRNEIFSVLAVGINTTANRNYEKQILQKSHELETMLYITSHDLREPLRAIRNFSQILEKRYSDAMDEKGRDFTRRIVNGAQRLDRLIEDILQLSRAQRQSTPDSRKPVIPCINEALARLENVIQTSGVRIEIEEDAFSPLYINEFWVTQAIFNLVSNAIKFQNPGTPGVVRIFPFEDQSARGIAVEDNGPGVPEELKEKIFQLFQRGVERRIQGTGAGLAIVRQVAENHGGKAWVENAPAGGARFYLALELFPEASMGVSPEGEPQDAPAGESSHKEDGHDESDTQQSNQTNIPVAGESIT